MFLLVLIEKEKYRYNYGRKWDKELMLDSKILLPQNAARLIGGIWIVIFKV